MNNKALIKTLEYAKERIYDHNNDHDMLVAAIGTINGLIELAKKLERIRK